MQFDGFRNRLMVLQDKLESERLAEIRRTATTRRSGRVQTYDGGGSGEMPGLERVVLPPLAPSAPLAPPKTITIGPDGVPEVAAPTPEPTQPAVGSKGRAAARRATAKANLGAVASSVVDDEHLIARPTTVRQKKRRRRASTVRPRSCSTQAGSRKLAPASPAS